MPPGGEDAARGFYRDLLGLDEEPKPAGLAARGGCWFRSGAVRLHLGVEADFRAARKAHPALRVSGFAGLGVFVQSEQIAVEPARSVLAAGRHRELDVIDPG